MRLRDHYEIDNVCDKIFDNFKKKILSAVEPPENKTAASTSIGSFTYKVALQFPDDQLKDANDVCWEIQKGLEERTKTLLSEISPCIHEFDQFLPLVVILGDTTHGSCCVDEFAALKIGADVVVHYGHACLSPTSTIPVIYSFGRTSLGKEFEFDCATKVLNELQKENLSQSLSFKLLVIYNVAYLSSISRIVDLLYSGGIPINDIVVGKIPDNDNMNDSTLKYSGLSKVELTQFLDDTCPYSQNEIVDDQVHMTSGILYIGGLKVVLSMDGSPNYNLNDYILLYIGHNTRHMVNVIQRCSGKDGTHMCWAYTTNTLNTDAASLCQKELHRRYFLIQKARRASVVGIVIGTLGGSLFQAVVEKLRFQILQAGRVCYIFAVGKINAAKLANFAEIEVFVLVACPENSILDNRDFHVPVLTPREMEIALDIRDWDGSCCHEFSDFLGNETSINFLKQDQLMQKEQTEVVSDNDDVPYFSMVTGKYEPKKISKRNMLTKRTEETTRDLKQLPGKGQLLAFESEAAEFLKEREYQGLDPRIGESEIHVAVQGRNGIASNYKNR